MRYRSGFALRALPGEAALPQDRNDFDVRLETFRSMARPGQVTLILAGWVVENTESTQRQYALPPRHGRKMPKLFSFYSACAERSARTTAKPPVAHGMGHRAL